MSESGKQERLARKLGTFDAVAIGLGAMLGAGAFVAPAAAAALAGSGVLLALVIAGVVAWANATSTARLAAAQPTSGGVYAYGRSRIGPATGFLAGWAFTAGKTSSLVAMALTFGAYATPGEPRAGALASVVALTAVNLAGVTRTAAAAKAGALVVVIALVAVAVATLGSAEATAANLSPVVGDEGARNLLGAAGIMFFAFAGYARIATLGEEVRDPERTIPRAVPIALAIAFLLYLATTAGALSVLGASGLAASPAPLADAVEAAGGPTLATAVRVAAAIAALGVLLSLMAGVSRTMFAMAADRELPGALASVHGTRRIPHVAQAAVGAIVAVLVLVVPTISAIATSSACILTYYAIAHLSALRLTAAQGRPRVLAPLGLIGCGALAVSLPWGDVVAAIVLLAGGMAARTAAQAGRERHSGV